MFLNLVKHASKNTVSGHKNIKKLDTDNMGLKRYYIALIKPIKNRKMTDYHLKVSEKAIDSCHEASKTKKNFLPICIIIYRDMRGFNSLSAVGEGAKSL